MLNALGTAHEDFKRHGHVLVHGEVWQAESKQHLNKGDKVRITRLDGLTLHVEPAQPESKEVKS